MYIRFVVTKDADEVFVCQVRQYVAGALVAAPRRATKEAKIQRAKERAARIADAQEREIIKRMEELAKWAEGAI